LQSKSLKTDSTNSQSAKKSILPKTNVIRRRNPTHVRRPPKWHSTREAEALARNMPGNNWEEQRINAERFSINFIITNYGSSPDDVHRFLEDYSSKPTPKSRQDIIFYAGRRALNL